MKLNSISRYGTIITCIVLAIVGIFTWLIKYPDTVTSRAKLTGTNAPKPIVVKQNLRLVKLIKQNNQEVGKGDIIAILESTANYEEIIKLEELLNQIDSFNSHGMTELIKSKMQISLNHLGELQGDYQAFVQAYIPYRDYVLGDYALKKKALLNKDLNIVNRSKSLINEKKKLQEKDLNLSQTTIEKNRRLLDEKLISEQEYRELSSQYLSKQMTEPQISADYIVNEERLNSINKEMVEIDNQTLTQQSLFEQAIYQLKTKIDAWKMVYLLTANNSGKLVFTSFLQENQNLNAGQILAHVVPDTSDIYMEMLIPQSNFGKVASGQQVILKFDAYPWQEFGAVMGQIDYISAVPVDSGFYLAKVVLPNSLMTNYKKNIPYVEGLLAQTEIITKDLRLAESLYYDLVKTIKK